MIEVVNTFISEVAEKLFQIEKEISQERGAFVLFALFEREDALGNWDVLISAEWIGENKKEVLSYITSKMSSKLLWQEQVLLSRIVILDPLDSFVASINTMIEIEHGDQVRFVNCNVNGIPIKDAFIITSKRPGSVNKESRSDIKKVGRNEPCPCGSGKKYKGCHGA
jgi:hypothetical protein